MRVLAVPLSLVLHALILGAVLLAWPTEIPEPEFTPPVPVDILTEAEFAELLSVPAQTAVEEPPAEEDVTPEEVVEETPPVEEVPELPVEDDVATVAAAPVEETPPAADPLPIDPPAETEPETAPEAQPQPDPTPEPEETRAAETPPAAVDPLAGLADALTDLEGGAPDRTRPSLTRDADGADTNQRQIGAGDRLTITERQLLEAKMERCWNRDLGAPNPETLIVEIEFSLNRDGSLRGEPSVVNGGQISRSGNQYWDAARTRALQGIFACEPYDFFDPARYDYWQSLNLRFRPTG